MEFKGSCNRLHQDIFWGFGFHFRSQGSDFFTNKLIKQAPFSFFRRFGVHFLRFKMFLQVAFDFESLISSFGADVKTSTFLSWASNELQVYKRECASGLFKIPRIF